MASTDWNTDFLDLLDCLSAEGAQFVIVGAFALAQHGLPRATGDRDFEQAGTVYQLGVVPRRIDILNELSGLSADEAWESRVERVIDGRSVPFLGYDSLLKNKRASARPKDLADVAALEQLKR